MDFGAIRKKIFYLLTLISFLCLPGIIYVFENEESYLVENHPNHWLWSFEDLKLSFIEAGCSLPFSNCEYRPYHRRILSYMIVNGLTCALCSVFFYPGYIIGQILPLPGIDFRTIVSIAGWEFGV